MPGQGRSLPSSYTVLHRRKIVKRKGHNAWTRTFFALISHSTEGHSKEEGTEYLEKDTFCPQLTLHRRIHYRGRDTIPRQGHSRIKIERAIFFLGTFSPNMRSWFPTMR